MASGIFSSTLSAVQASLSVLLVITYGALSAKWGLLDPQTGKAISKICVKMFLPALLIVQIGSELKAHSAHRYLIILAWAFICHAISFGIGIAAHFFLGMPDWTTAAIMFNNTTSYPLLLIQSLEETGILGRLVGDSDMERAIERAKSYFLVFATVSSCLTFAVGPRLIDTENAPDEEEVLETREDPKSRVIEEYEDDERFDGEDGDPEIGRSGYRDDGAPNETTSLLGGDSPPRSPQDRYRKRLGSVTSITFFPSKPNFTTVTRHPFYIPRLKWSNFGPRTKWWLLFFYDFLNAPLLGAVLGTIIGLTPPLRRALFNDTYNGGIFSAWLTESLKNIGGLFVPLPLIVAGISLYTSYQESRQGNGSSRTAVPWTTMGFILTVRFILWPVLSIGMIYTTVKNSGRDGFLGSDPMLWFAMMLMPTGPPAMKLITMVQVSDAGVDDERRIAKILTISYIVSPILAFTVVGALRASQAAL